MKKYFLSVFLFSIIFLYASVFIIPEGQRGILLRFDKVLRDQNSNAIIYFPGVHTKIPFIEKIKKLDARIQTMENQADRFVTMEKKDLIVDSYIKWKISDFSRYYLATGGGDISRAEVLIKRKFSDRLRSELGKLDVRDIVTDSRNQLMTDVKNSLNFGSNEDTDQKTDFKNKNTYTNSIGSLGIHIVDVRIKQINLPIEVSDAIYQRMRAEREAVARRHRSQGQEEAEKLRATADYEVTKILSEAKSRSLIIKGEADAEAYKLYSEAFSKDPEFYNFLRLLRSYKNIFQDEKKNLIFLDSENEFLKFMKPIE
ncbi:protease modulator HflC [bacterium endosymbiont of Pedicinus badii]|uniref:protease modulator HflC n=1 Tax=bacterium endosymbiont of Pedicinus badii TaxID=1719126 RepID=UPI0009B9A652|nr:protease modulator HflC [bacterium endosymbiont of Pedicinus badii]OQM34177.1 cell division protein FtsH [bacterium endosymbiont of Pedicinus badii]